jgi:glycosyltransferase involved in cell wall biosynthesis
LLVTGLLVTRGRPEMAAQAVKCFQSQTYARKNLLIIDDVDQPSFSSWINQSDMLRLLLPKRFTIGAKRNIGVTHATGEIIMTMDSDDWSAPDRMADQVNRLLSSTKNVTGYYEMLFHEIATDQWMKYPEYPDPNYALGTSLCYKRDWAVRHPFDEVNVGEDNAAVTAARNGRELYSVAGLGMMVARIHADNTNKNLDWRETSHQVSAAVAPSGYTWPS